MKLFPYRVKVCVCGGGNFIIYCVHWYRCMSVPMEARGDSSFLFTEGSGDRTPIIRFAQQTLLPTTPSCQSKRELSWIQETKCLLLKPYTTLLCVISWSILIHNITLLNPQGEREHIIPPI